MTQSNTEVIRERERISKVNQHEGNSGNTEWGEGNSLTIGARHTERSDGTSVPGRERSASGPTRRNSRFVQRATRCAESQGLRGQPKV